MPNTVTWLTNGTKYPRLAAGDNSMRLWVKTSTFGTGGNGVVQFTLDNTSSGKGVSLDPLNGIANITDNGNGVYLANIKLILPSSLTDTDQFTVTAAPLTSASGNDGIPVAANTATSVVLDLAKTGASISSNQTYATTPGDPGMVGKYYQIFTNVISSTGAAVQGVPVVLTIDPSITAKLYIDNASGTEALSGVPGTYYLNSGTNGRATLRLATLPGVNIQVIKVTGDIIGSTGQSPTANFFFSKTPDGQDLDPSWQNPSCPDAQSGGCIPLTGDQQTFRLTVPINDATAQDVIYRGVVINDTSAFTVGFLSTQTVDVPVTKLNIDPSPGSNWFTVFSQDNVGSITCSGSQGYCVSGTLTRNLPDKNKSPRVTPEPTVDPYPWNGILTKNAVNAHDGLGLKLTDILIADLGLSDKGNPYDITKPVTDTSVVFTFYMNGYEAANSQTVRIGTYNRTDEFNSPVPTLKYNPATDPTSLVWTQPLVALAYAFSVGWYTNPNAKPPRQTCGFEYYIQQMQGSISNKWYSKLDIQLGTPYLADITA